METEGMSQDDPVEAARAQLRTFDDASAAAEVEAHAATPLWFWPVMALLAPAAVSLRRLDGSERILALVLTLTPVLVASVVMARNGRRLGAKALNPTRGGRLIWWRLPMMMCCIGGLQLTSILQWANGLALAVFTYCLIAFGSGFFALKVDQRSLIPASRNV